MKALTIDEFLQMLSIDEPEVTQRKNLHKKFKQKEKGKMRVSKKCNLQKAVKFIIFQNSFKN